MATAAAAAAVLVRYPHYNEPEPATKPAENDLEAGKKGVVIARFIVICGIFAMDYATTTSSGAASKSVGKRHRGARGAAPGAGILVECRARGAAPGAGSLAMLVRRLILGTPPPRSRTGSWHPCGAF